MYRISSLDDEFQDYFKNTKNEFSSKDDANNFLTEYLLFKFKKENKEVDSTFFDELDFFEIEEIYYCECCR